MKARDLVRELIEGDLDAEVLLLSGKEVDCLCIVFRRSGVVAFGTGTYGTDSPAFKSAIRSYRRRPVLRKASV